MGHGLIDEVDDIREANPAVNEALLSYLEDELSNNKYDLKALFRIILNSNTYQQSSIPESEYSKAYKNFGCYPVRQMEAEVLIDNLSAIFGFQEKYSSDIPEPFTFVPAEFRTTSLADGSISSHFLELFGRSARDTGLESERNNRPTSQQRLHLLNSTHIQRKIKESKRLRLLQGKLKIEELTTLLYLTILSRQASSDEVKIIKKYVAKSKLNRQEILADLAWALINSKEFLFRH